MVVPGIAVLGHEATRLRNAAAVTVSYSDCVLGTYQLLQRRSPQLKSPQSADASASGNRFYPLGPLPFVATLKFERLARSPTDESTGPERPKYARWYPGRPARTQYGGSECWRTSALRSLATISALERAEKTRARCPGENRCTRPPKKNSAARSPSPDHRTRLRRWRHPVRGLRRRCPVRPGGARVGNDPTRQRSRRSSRSRSRSRPLSRFG
jgi:hypothetical protein